MYNKMLGVDAYDISEEEYYELCKQPGAPLVIEAVRRYNELVSKSGYVEHKDINALLVKRAEEEDAKAFLEGVFDITQRNK